MFEHLHNLRRAFNHLVKQHEEKKLFEERVDLLMDAINKKDGQTVTALFGDLAGSFLLTTSVYNDLLKAAINTDDVGIFSTVLGNSKPDYWFESKQSFDVPLVVTRQEHILYVAIEAGSKAIALSLVKNKAVSIDKSGETDTASAWNDSVKRYDPPILLANRKHMDEVVAVLEQRISEEAAAKAKQNKPKGGVVGGVTGE